MVYVCHCRFLGAVVTYFVVGAVVMRYRYGAQTITETLPNSGFWMEVPFLIKVQYIVHTSHNLRR